MVNHRLLANPVIISVLNYICVLKNKRITYNRHYVHTWWKLEYSETISDVTRSFPDNEMDMVIVLIMDQVLIQSILFCSLVARSTYLIKRATRVNKDHPPQLTNQALVQTRSRRLASTSDPEHQDRPIIAGATKSPLAKFGSFSLVRFSVRTHVCLASVWRSDIPTIKTANTMDCA
jgi:hypothetical protein